MRHDWAEELPHDLEPLSEPGGSLRGRLNDGREVTARVVSVGSTEEGDRLIAHLRRLGRLDDARLVPVVGVARDDEDAVWVLTELDAGVSLRTLLERGPLSSRQAAAAGVEILAGLAALHAAGFTHGALHPGNVHISSGGRVRLSDYGLRVAPGEAGKDLAAAGVLLCAALGVPELPTDGDLSDAERAAPALVATARALAAGRGGRSASAAAEALRSAAGRAVPSGLPPAPPAPPSSPAPVAAGRGRPVGLVAVLLLAAALLTGLGAALGVLTTHGSRPTASTSGPVARTPVPSAPPARVPTPGPTEAPTPPPATPPPPAPPPATPPPTASPPAASPAGGSPDTAVADFYQLVAAHQFDAAIALWSVHMQASYPPGENVYQRFANTTSLTLVRDQVTAPSDASATVSIDLIEVRGGQTYHWVGSWYLVHQPAGWLLDQPALRLA